MRQKKQTTKLKKFNNTKDAIKIAEKIQLVQIRMLLMLRSFCSGGPWQTLRTLW